MLWGSIDYKSLSASNSKSKCGLESHQKQKGIAPSPNCQLTEKIYRTTVTVLPVGPRALGNFLKGTIGASP